MELPRLGVELELQLLACATATVTPDLSHICNLHHSSWQCQILNPLSGARDQTHLIMDTSQICSAEPQQELLLEEHLRAGLKCWLFWQKKLLKKESFMTLVDEDKADFIQGDYDGGVLTVGERDWGQSQIQGKVKIIVSGERGNRV